MSTLTQFMPGLPTKVTILTSGAGTFVPIVANSFCRITLVGSGGGGGSGANASSNPGGCGGSGGGTSIHWLMVLGNTSYNVGVGGAGANTVSGGASLVGANGQGTFFGPIFVPGGLGGQPQNNTQNTFPAFAFGYAKANISQALTTVNTTITIIGTSGIGGYNGGAGGIAGSGGIPAQAGGAAGMPCVQNTTSFAIVYNGTAAGGTSSGSGQGGGGGGDSGYGNGGAGGNGGVNPPINGGNGTGYGSGGGGGATNNANPSSNGGNGANGVIIIEEFGPEP